MIEDLIVELPVTDKTIGAVVSEDEYVWTRNGIVFFMSGDGVNISLYFKNQEEYEKNELLSGYVEQVLDSDVDEESIMFCDSATIVKDKITGEVTCWLDNSVPIMYDMTSLLNEEKE